MKNRTVPKERSKYDWSQKKKRVGIDSKNILGECCEYLGVLHSSSDPSLLTPSLPLSPAVTTVFFPPSTIYSVCVFFL